MTPRRLLFLSHLDPYGTERGASLRTRGILEVLQQGFEVDFLGLDRDGSSHLASQSRPDRVLVKARWTKNPGFIAANLVSLLTGKSYTYHAYASQAIERTLRAWLVDRRYDVVHVDSIDLVRYLPRLAGSRFTLTHHNVESMLLARQAASTRNGLRRRYLTLQAARVLQNEKIWAPRAAANIMVSAEDASALLANAPSAGTHIIPNGVDTSYFTPETGNGCLPMAIFTGGLDYRPNSEAFDWFTELVAPRIRKVLPSFQARFVGAAGAEFSDRASPDSGIEVTGYVADIRPYFRDAACAIVPLRTGGGTRVKILTAWAMGLPVVSTRLGCEGLEFQDGVHGFVRDTPEQFAEAVIALLQDRETRVAMGQNGRTHVEQVYSWQALREPILNWYHGLLD